MMKSSKKTLFIGDIHGRFDDARNLIKSIDVPFDRIIQLGDFGWWPGNINPWVDLPQVECRWIDGNHENFHYLWNWEEKKTFFPRWQDMMEVWKYMPRGTVEDGILFIGGAHSIDKYQRTPGVDWFPEENITQADVERCLEACDGEEIHTVVSHDCPAQLGIVSMYKDVDSNRKALQIIFDEVKPKKWLFGHHHRTWEVEMNDCWFRCVDMIRGNPVEDYVLM